MFQFSNGLVAQYIEVMYLDEVVARIDLTYTSFVVFLERLCEMLVVDCNGVNLREVFIKAFGDWRFLLLER